MFENPLMIVGIVIIVLLLVLVLKSKKTQPATAADPYQEIAERFGTNPGQGVTPEVAQWVRDEMRTRGIDPNDTPIQAMKALRDAKPGLSLSAAKAIIEAVRNVP